MLDTLERAVDDVVHTGPGTLAGRYMRMFWQPVARSSEVAPGQAIALRIMSDDFTLYRGESSDAHVLASQCAHRGTALSVGWVEDDCLRCFYHGWKYDASGQCVEQPGEDAAFAAKVKIRSYPTQEYLGLVFAYLGEGNPPLLRRYPAIEESGVLDVYPPELWPCNYFNRIDNACDALHTVFAHRASRQAIGVAQELPVVQTEETDYGVRRVSTRPGRTPMVSYFFMPNVTFVNSDFKLRDPNNPAATGYLYHLLWQVPVDDEHCLNFIVDHVPLTGEEGEQYLERRRSVQDAQLEAPELGAAILAGKMRLADIVDRYPDNLKVLTSVEDYLAQVGQGTIMDHASHRLGRHDEGLITVHRLWSRELHALAEGQSPWFVGAASVSC